MRLDELLERASRLGVASRRGDLSVDITGVTHDSRLAGPGSLFVCIVGERADGHDHAPAAVAAGARALVVQRPLGLGVAEVEVPDSRVAIGPLAAAFHGEPARALVVAGVTGTNGKTTTTQLLTSIMQTHGWVTETVGTLTGPRTTPEATDLQATLAGWRDHGVAAVAMEVSSHALTLHRVDAMWFRVAVFTNLSRDHLDFHETTERYFAAKARLFEPDLTEQAVVNADDPHGRLLLDAARVPTTSYSMTDAADLRVGAATSRFRWRGVDVELPVGGRFNVANALAAATAAATLGIAPATIAEGLARTPVVPGRFESLERGQPFHVVVDYAHTPDALDQVLAAARELAGDHRVIVVFGCGGDRDRTKRPHMGAAAARGADLTVLTSDNPRGEDPGAIIEAVRTGVPSSAALVVEPDRRQAIAQGLARAGAGDVVVIAGKGHERTQVIGELALPFDDRVVAGEEIDRLQGGPPSGAGR